MQDNQNGTDGSTVEAERTNMTISTLCTSNIPAVSKMGRYIIRKKQQKRLREVVLNMFAVWITFVACWMPLIFTHKVDYYKQVGHSCAYTCYHCAPDAATIAAAAAIV